MSGKPSHRGPDPRDALAFDAASLPALARGRGRFLLAALARLRDRVGTQAGGRPLQLDRAPATGGAPVGLLG